MRAAIICVLFTLIVQKEGSHAEQNDDFKPTPIPLNSWSAEKLDPAGTLQEFIKNDASSTVAALPAHYWEDALRHSVYLTLVRDKIDQLIAKGSIISPDSKPDNSVSKEVDDHDLWEKIKAAPFDRVKEDPLPPGDVIILARGRLLEEKNGFRFAEGDEKCDKNNCTQPVKAYWSVKRTRQSETPSGKYHYELTFSVTSEAPRKLKKPFANPVRTFTIRENTPSEHRPTQASRNYGRHSDRTQRAIWVHKNIAPRQNYQNRPESSHGLERIFSSLFSDDDNYDEVTYRKPNTYMSHPYPQQNAKVGFVRDREQYQHKKIIPYNIKPQTFSYSRPPLPPPPVSYMQHPHVDTEQIVLNPHLPFTIDNRYMPPNPIKTTKPAFLPTPVTNYQLLKESTVDVPIKTTLNATKPTTDEPEIITKSTYKIYNNKQAPTKTSYFSDNIRPPIYNAPPGVFATMDKKPFKPMPPLKLKQSSKPPKNTPLDFRPSPQILDTTYTDEDAAADNVFRPITLNLTEFLSSKKGPKNNRKHTLSKKPSKKHENIKSHRLTTVSPDIITVSAESGDDDDMQWAEILGAFTRTTPMASQKEKEILLGSDILTTTRETPTTTTETSEESTTIGTTSSTSTTTSTTTTVKPKRTRPPPKFTKPDRIKKHKRITSTTTSTTTTSKPMRKYSTKKPTNDLMPQASSAATGGANNVWESIDKKASTSTMTTSTTTTMSTTSTTTTPSTTQKISTTSVTPSRTEDSATVVVTTQPKSKNRFRQSTLMQKGTSVNHDKWSTSTSEKNRTVPATSNQYSVRRKASKFQGYVPSSTPRQPEVEKNREDHVDHGLNFNSEISSTQITIAYDVKTTQTTQPSVERSPQENKYYNNQEVHDNPLSDNETEDKTTEIDVEDEKENSVHDTKDDSEYIFPIVSHTPESNPESKRVEKQSITEHTVIALPHTVTKNNTKCKKKKHENNTATENLQKSNEIVSVTNVHSTNTATTTVSTVTTPDIFGELFGGFTMDDVLEKQKSSVSTAPEPSESVNHEKYIPINDDIEHFLHSLNQNSNETGNEENSDEEYEDDSDDEDSPFNNEEDNLDSRQINGEYYDDSSEIQSQESKDRPYSLFELMAME